MKRKESEHITVNKSAILSILFYSNNDNNKFDKFENSPPLN